MNNRSNDKTLTHTPQDRKLILKTVHGHYPPPPDLNPPTKNWFLTQSSDINAFPSSSISQGPSPIVTNVECIYLPDCNLNILKITQSNHPHISYITRQRHQVGGPFYFALPCLARALHVARHDTARHDTTQQHAFRPFYTPHKSAGAKCRHRTKTASSKSVHWYSLGRKKHYT